MPSPSAVATIHTNHGDIVVNLFGDQAPRTVQNFIGLADGSQAWTHPATGQPGEGPLYTDVIFHRIIPGFMIQGGDPDGNGMGGGPRRLKAEFNAKKHVPGVLSMARSNDPNSASCQFFVMHGVATHLDNQYSGFGQLVSGLDVVDRIVNTPRQGERPKTPQIIERAIVVLAPADVAAWKAQK